MDIKSIKRIGVLPQDPENIYKIGIDAEDINNDNNTLLTTKVQNLSQEQKDQVKLNLDIKEQQKKQILNYVTPEQFGAKGDGKTDDSGAFLLALETGHKVICDSTKAYFFDKPIAAHNLCKGHLDGNQAHFINFHIFININQAENDWHPHNSSAQTIFIIENMQFKHPGGYWDNFSPGDWEKPLITTGCVMKISNITTSYPYVLATTENYLDYMQCERWNFVHNPNHYEDKELKLDAISCLNSKGQYCKFGAATTPKAAGDSWILRQCSEFAIESKPEYKLMSISKRQALIVESCIQSSFDIDSGSSVIFQGCHWESKSNVTFEENLRDSTIQFNSCYFYCNHKLNDTPFTIYNQCKFAAGPYLNAFPKRGVPLSELTNNKSFYDLQCKLIDCYFGENYIINTDYMLLSKYLPKKTYNKNCTKERKTLDTYNRPAELLEGLSSSTNNYFKEAGAYTYQLYLRTTSQDNIALDSIEKQYQIDDIKKQYRIGLKVPYVNGGCSLYIIRTSPSGVKEYTEFYGNPNTFKDINEDMCYMFYDFGTYNTFTIEKNDWQLKGWLYKTTLQPWISLETNPEFIFNKQLYEANGALITLNGETLLFDLNGQAQLFNYINLDELYFHNFDNNMETTNILGQGKLGFMKLGGK